MLQLLFAFRSLKCVSRHNNLCTTLGCVVHTSHSVCSGTGCEMLGSNFHKVISRHDKNKTERSTHSMLEEMLYFEVPVFLKQMKYDFDSCQLISYVVAFCSDDLGYSLGHRLIEASHCCRLSFQSVPRFTNLTPKLISVADKQLSAHEAPFHKTPQIFYGVNVGAAWRPR